jgi:hypothetical protein
MILEIGFSIATWSLEVTSLHVLIEFGKACSNSKCQNPESN